MGRPRAVPRTELQSGDLRHGEEPAGDVRAVRCWYSDARDDAVAGRFPGSGAVHADPVPQRQLMRAAAFAAFGVLAMLAGACTGSDGVSGHACIVFDLRNPGRCGEMQDVGGLHVVEVASGHDATTDGNGEFRISLPEGSSGGVLRVADNRTDRRIS